MDKKNVRITVSDKILLLLLDYTRYRGELQAPPDITQEGIADRLEIIRSAIPRAVGGLIEKRWVEEYLAHIEGLSRRRKVYALTDTGVLKAREMLERIGAIEIDVEDESGRKKRTIHDLLSMKAIKLSELSKALLVRKLDLRKDRQVRREDLAPSYTQTLNPPALFLDREREMEEISSAIRSPKRKVTVIYGIAGVGKTTLAWKISQDFGTEMNVFYLDIKEWTSLNYLLTELSEFLCLIGWSQLKDYIEEGGMDIEAFCDLFKNIPRDIPLLIIFDDLHRAPREVLMFLSSFKERLMAMKGVDLVVMSRTRAGFYDIRDVRISGMVGELELLGFEPDVSRTFLLNRGFSPDSVDAIVEKIGGHPLALALVEKEGDGADISDFDDFLRQEIFSRLSEMELKALSVISLCRLQLGDEELLGVAGVDEGTLSHLMDNRLIFHTPSGYIVHDLIRDQSVSNMAAKERSGSHRDIAGVFLEKLQSSGFYQDIGDDVPPSPLSLEDAKGLGPTPMYVSEAMSHLLLCGDHERALDMLVRAILQIPSGELLPEFSKYYVPLREKKDDRSILQSFYHAFNHIHRGEHERSIRYLNMVSGSEPRGDLASACRIAARFWMPWAVERVKGPAEALSILDGFTGDIDQRMRYYFLTYRASLMYKLGDHKGSSDAYGKFLEEVLANEEFPLQLKETVSESMKNAREGQIQKATDNFQKIMELTRANRDLVREMMPFVDVDHHLLSAIYSVFYGRKIRK
ncbi:MAG: ATP-binding protein [Candidatus Thermoplasmatota archaeon]|nr:ATP-binding protein [Candidatus Thermoplasmatota archaeon]